MQQREYLTENSHVFEEIIAFGLGKFEIDPTQSKYAVDLIRTNKFYYLQKRAALKDLLASIIKHKPMYNAFLDWLDTICQMYLVDSEKQLIPSEIKHPNVIWGRVDELEDRITNIEKRIEVLLDLIEELAKKV
jgi:hypothetical protein